MVRCAAVCAAVCCSMLWCVAVCCSEEAVAVAASIFFERTLTKWRRGIECLIFIGQFLQKSPIICCALAKNDLQLRASYGSSPPCSSLLNTEFSKLWCSVLQFVAVWCGAVWCAAVYCSVFVACCSMLQCTRRCKGSAKIL